MDFMRARYREDLLMYKVDELLYLVRKLLVKEVRMSVQMDTLIAEVAETTTVQESAAKAIQGIAAQLEEAIAKMGMSAEDAATLQKLADDLNASTNALAAAIPANTPTEPPVVEPPVEEPPVVEEPVV